MTTGAAHPFSRPMGDDNERVLGTPSWGWETIIFMIEMAWGPKLADLCLSICINLDGRTASQSGGSTCGLDDVPKVEILKLLERSRG